ncbi:type ISP restriction/modification enzyme [Moraxella sp. ZY210820]|uniref:DEAD/DEAH box helicase n=1 Tax=Moraxella sp. ZY210820 TaxID=2904123 RepID=UPI002731161C|nr:type ISP restriction/modification enzyme [Moraxella sp. ZY210820]WLF85077.1 DEAD/DEAH box helicase family protein [Moraxella sp. ZY210820]
MLEQYQALSHSQREKGTYFERLCIDYLTTENHYKALYQSVLPFADWISQYKPTFPKTDTGIDLVAIGFDGTLTAIQCKNYSADYRIAKSDIDSFFTASGKSDFSHRLIIATTDHWSDNAQNALSDQQIPVNVISRTDLENSVIDWERYTPNQTPILHTKKTLRDHQSEALNAVKKGFETANRGKLIMACGTGKTFTSLKIAEDQAGIGKMVLFLVPSLALLSQSLTEWTQQSDIPIYAYAVCSDSDVGKQKDDDLLQTQIHELQFPATTNAKSLCNAIKNRANDTAMTVIFSTYHSIDVISQAQKLGLGEFELIICDEAHRTTGATFENTDESHFVKIHHNDFIQAKKRLYMTATPKVYSDSAKKTEGVEAIYSMDNVEYYGKEFYTISFSRAVNLGLLVDYKVLVLAISESHINRQLEKLLNDDKNEYKVDDVAKIIGCWKALSKYGVETELSDDYNPMKRAVAFCQVIDKYTGKHKVSSKAISGMFNEVVSAYQAQEIKLLKEKHKTDGITLNPSLQLNCEANHIDGSMNASQKANKINWLKENTPDNTCRILSNVRCLSEGVDVPALDAVLFLSARNSPIDVVQSVGRVMRKADGKKRGYVILPIVIPAGIEPETALDNNENYKVVWQVLNALRSHDDRFDAILNKLEFGAGSDKIEITAIADNIKAKVKKSNKTTTRGKNSIGQKDDEIPVQGELDFNITDIERALVAKIVKKCGNRMHWQEWAANVAQIANTHTDRIKAILENTENHTQINAFNEFANQLRNDLNHSTTDNEAIEMLSQHLITKPIFDALFSESEFAKFNPMSIALDKVIDALALTNISDKETKELNEFYDAIAIRVSGIKEPAHRQRIIKELYDNFFRTAFPKLSEKMGIVYTPIEVVDFIIHSIEYILKSEFNASLNDKGVQIIDPFTGTGTFITRLLQSGIIDNKNLPQKYQEIHANEMLLLAYYIATINIESIYHSLIIDDYKPFKGICLADTFAMYEHNLIALSDNSQRQKRQKELDITVIMGNPPYSAKQEIANDNNANFSYPMLDNRIRLTYAQYGKSVNQNSLYDPYIRAIRWATDRIKDRGVIGFITNSGYINSNSSDGLRKCLSDEFSSLYIFNLRGAIRGKAGDTAKKEGQNVFDIMTGVAIAILVKNPNSKNIGKIYYYDIGNYLNRQEKLDKITHLKSIENIVDWQQIIPDEFNDWLNQRDTNFDKYISMGDKKDKNSVVIFNNYSRGLATARDAWCYNYSKKSLIHNMSSMINFYNFQLSQYLIQKENNEKIELDDIIDYDSSKISWNRSLKNDFARGKNHKFDNSSIRIGLYRPFSKTNVYFNRSFNDMIYQLPKLFPNDQSENLVISITGLGTPKEFSVIITDCIPDLQLQANGQCFPLYLYEPITIASSHPLFQGQSFDTFEKKDAISDEAFEYFQSYYKMRRISKEQIFYYIYGLLHSPEYRQRYADNLSKQLPRIPRVKSVDDFLAFEKAGRALANLHLNYESVPMYDNIILQGGIILVDDKIIGGSDDDFYVSKMKFGKRKNKETGKNEDDKTVIIYNENFTISNIPLSAYDYVVNGKSAIEWVIERQSIKTDKASGITNNANDWACETMNNARYPLELLLRVITVSLETMKIVNGLPSLVLE